ncbi:MAG: ATP-binding protein [Saprospiraceae bacterium]|nr:ATP-binding protein [Saprospiraceae bacterium]
MINIERKTAKLIERQLFAGKIILLLGARRVGKTFLCKELISKYNGVYYNCELNETKDLLASQSKVVLGNLIGKSRLVVFDEAQDIPDIGKKLKILYDEFPDVQIIATGSSSFDLINKTSEPLTGRSRIYQLYPLSYSELVDHDSLASAHGQLDNILRFGLYPEVFNHALDQKIEELENIASNYLFKDMLLYGDLRRPDIILEILKLIAYQIGGELSLNEISNKTNTSVHTVKRYLDMLEKSFVIFSLNGFSRNLRKEIGKSKKYYFFDLGIRNALIRNFNPIDSRNDIGMLWGEFLHYRAN